MGAAARRSEKEPPIVVKGCFEKKDSKAGTIVKMIFQSGNLNRSKNSEHLDGGGGGGGGGGYIGGWGMVLDCVTELEEVAGDVLRRDHHNAGCD